MKLKKITKIIIYIVSILHILLLAGIIYYDNRYIEHKTLEVEVKRNLYDNKPLLLKVSDSQLKLETYTIEIGKILVINDKLSYEIEEIENIYYKVYDRFLLLIFKDYNDNYRLLFIDGNLNVIQDLKEVSEKNEIYNIYGDYPIKLYKDYVIINMENKKNKIEYKLTWDEYEFFSSIKVLK